MQKLLDIIPDTEQELKDRLSESTNPREVLMNHIGWPTDQWHWDALSAITGKSYEELKEEMEPED